MIDYVKLLVVGVDIERLLSLRHLDFVSELNEATGELSTVKTAVYHHCKITVHQSGTILFSGSLHKLYNSLVSIYTPNYNPKQNLEYKGYNGNLFTLDRFIEVREHLAEIFDCSPKQMIFQNIEFGINCILDYTPQLFIKGLLYHKGKEFEFSKRGRYAQAIHNNYILKIYNKSEQYGIENHTLRVEIKVRRTEHLKRINIKAMSDINKTSLIRAFELLLQTFKGLVYFDYTLNIESLSAKEKERVKLYSNPRFWLNDLASHHRDRHKKQLLKMISNASSNLKKGIITEMRAKCVMINSSSIGLNITQEIHSHYPFKYSYLDSYKIPLQIP